MADRKDKSALRRCVAGAFSQMFFSVEITTLRNIYEGPHSFESNIIESSFRIHNTCPSVGKQTAYINNYKL